MKAGPIHYLIYPAVVCFSLGLYAYSLFTGVALATGAFGSVVVGALLIAAFELITPYDQSWTPRPRDVWNDFLFMAVIQVAVPRLIGLLLAVSLAERVGRAAPLSGLWPHEWPMFAQTMLLIVTADFMRYWLHRAAHTLPILWRLHAVHHSPDRLYWLNTSRFHPIEKVLQFALDSLPFILMGVSPEILGFWFVLYSVNGFFQHSNIRLEFGLLSKIFSTAEMHRWHHSQTPAESNTNYANVFILWDRFFGTYFRPLARRVGDLGLVYVSYPMEFGAQMKAPFDGKLYK